MSAPTTIDYTDKDYDSLRRAMLQLARLRLPEWTDRSPADLGVLLVDLFAYMGDVVLYYQDRIANESFLQTATERRSVLHLLRLIGYELSAPRAATADLLLTFRVPAGPTLVTIPKGARFATRGKNVVAQEFQYIGPDILIDLASDQVRPGPAPMTVVFDGLPVEQSRNVGPIVLGSSTGEPNQSFAIADAPIIAESLVVEVNEGAGWVRWDARQSLLFDVTPGGRVLLSSPDARVYRLVYDEKSQARVVFGDGKFARIPPPGLNNVRVAARVGGGALANVAAGTISEAKTAIPNLASVINPEAAAGGVDAEPTAHAARFGPEAFRSRERAVTLADYQALAHRAGGVAKARARSRSWNRVELFVAPEGERCAPIPEALRKQLLAYFEDKRMAGVSVQILDAEAATIDISAEIVFDERFHWEAVRAGAESAVRALLAFANVDFGQPVYQSDFFAAIEAVPGVRAVSIPRFRRRDASLSDVEVELQRYQLPALASLPEFLRRALQVDIAPSGRIEVGEFEIPALGELVLTARGGA
jgi:uncharacterized phage protein gp47/JayE